MSSCEYYITIRNLAARGDNEQFREKYNTDVACLIIGKTHVYYEETNFVAIFFVIIYGYAEV